jgi:opacity protein-like surface antigen
MGSFITRINRTWKIPMPSVLWLLLLVATATAAAEDNSNPRLELTPYAGYGVGGDFKAVANGAEIELDGASNLGLIVNFQADANTQWEFLYLGQGTRLGPDSTPDSTTGLDVDVHYLHGGGTYIFSDHGVQPYIAATIGLSRFDPFPSEFSSENHFSFSIGAGLRFFPDQRVGIRLEGRLFSTLVDSQSEVFCRTGGLNNFCALQVDGSLINQWHALLGATFRF